MINYGTQYSTTQPQELEITTDSVFVATNITPYSKEIEGHTISGYQYDYKKYSLSEYLALQNATISSLSEELQAAKILLGVD
jgi:hypothetical protein